MEGVPAAHQLFYLDVTKYSRILSITFKIRENKAFYLMSLRYKSMLMDMGSSSSTAVTHPLGNAVLDHIDTKNWSHP